MNTTSNLYKLTIVNSSVNKKINVYLQDCGSCQPTQQNSRLINPSARVILACENPTGNLFVAVDGDEKWKGMVPTGIVLYYNTENNTLRDDSGEIPQAFVTFSQEKGASPIHSKFLFKRGTIIGIIAVVIILLIIVYYYYRRDEFY